MFRHSVRIAASSALVALGLAAGTTSADAINSSPKPTAGATHISPPGAVVGVTRATIGPSGAPISFGGSSVIVPTMPNTTAPSAVWQNWVTQWNDSLNPQVITASLEEAGCVVSNVDVSPMSAAAAAELGYPVGVIPDGGSAIVNCSHAISTSARHPMSTPGAGYTDLSVGGQGSQIVESCTIGGAASVCAIYEYTGAYQSTITGHVELSTDGALATTCSVGNLVQNSPSETLDVTGEAIAYDPTSPSGSNVWNGNFWQGTSSPYLNEGNACASI